MAEVLTDEMPATRKGRPRIYPWAEWTDGRVWRITRGQDFHCGVLSMRQHLYHRARVEGLLVTVSVEGRVGAYDSIRFRFYPKPEYAARPVPTRPAA